ncbi:AAR2 protein-domain-containing protein [Stachybotrys elegans]|uniref:AAR2 protein-domain-containing protein n=1 Tax=Stachybotrys elegans TaxID=80388 RepID=A0A8K0SCA4_9HYPO|nr:AAR2 protein-domain-containing protein [Stachybotrys elegans]
MCVYCVKQTSASLAMNPTAEAMGDEMPPPPPTADSNSTASANGSIASHISIRALGAHPLGTLRVLHPDIPLDEDEDEEMGEPAYALHGGPAPQGSSSLPRTDPVTLCHDQGGGDVVLILDLPEIFTVGYDSISFTAKHFGGVRDVPAGAHFFWVSHPDGLSPRSGFWIQSTGNDRVHVVQWDRYNEMLCDPIIAEARYRLIPYRYPTATASHVGPVKASGTFTNLDMWRQLTLAITEPVLNKILAQNGGCWIVHTADRVSGSIRLPGELALDRALSKSTIQNHELQFVFTQTAKTFSTENTGRDRTLEATDSTPYIQAAIDQSGRRITPEQMLGELQFSFLMGMHLGNDSCIQQWWYMVLKLVLRAYLLPAREPALASALLRTLAAQLKYNAECFDGSIFDNNETKAHEFRIALTIYKRRLEEFLAGLGSNADPDQRVVGTTFASVEAVLADISWDISGDYVRIGRVVMEDGEEVELETDELQEEDERGEWAPEIVELDDEGRERGLVSWSD